MSVGWTAGEVNSVAGVVVAVCFSVVSGWMEVSSLVWSNISTFGLSHFFGMDRPAGLTTACVLLVTPVSSVASVVVRVLGFSWCKGLSRGADDDCEASQALVLDALSC